MLEGRLGRALQTLASGVAFMEMFSSAPFWGQCWSGGPSLSVLLDLGTMESCIARWSLPSWRSRLLQRREN